MTPENDAAARYFSAITAALSGLEVFMRDDRSPLYRHGIVAKIVAEYIARLDKSFCLLAQPAGLHGHVPHFARRKRFSGLPEPARTGKRPPPGRQPPRQHPAGRRIARGDGRLHPAPQGVPRSAAEVDGRAALSRGRQERADLRAVHAGADRQGLGQSEDGAALLSRPLGDLRRQRQPAAGLHGDGGGFLRRA